MRPVPAVNYPCRFSKRNGDKVYFVFNAFQITTLVHYNQFLNSTQTRSLRQFMTNSNKVRSNICQWLFVRWGQINERFLRIAGQFNASMKLFYQPVGIYKDKRKMEKRCPGMCAPSVGNFVSIFGLNSLFFLLNRLYILCIIESLVEYFNSMRKFTSAECTEFHVITYV